MIRKGGIVTQAVRSDWRRAWPGVVDKHETDAAKKMAGAEAEIFPPPSGAEVLGWDDLRSAKYIKSRALQIKERVKRRESVSMARLATGQLMGLVGNLETRKCNVGVGTWNEILHYLSWGGNTSLALKIFHKMHRRTPATYQHVVNSLARDYTTTDDVLYEVLREFKNSRKQKTPELYLAVMRYFSNRADHEKTRKILESMIALGVPPGSQSWGLLITSSPNFDTAFKYLRELISSGGRVLPFHVQAVLRAAARGKNDVEKAEKFFNRLRQGTWGGDDLPPLPINVTLDVVHGLLQVYSKSGLTASLKRRMSELLDTHNLTATNITYCILMEGNVNRARSSPKSHEALTLYAQGVLHQALSEGIQSCRRLYHLAMQFYSITGDVSSARNLRDTASSNGVMETEVYLKYFAEVFRKAGTAPRESELDRREPHVKSRFDFARFSDSQNLGKASF